MNNESGNKNTWKVFGVLVVLMGGLLLSIYVVGQNQENRSKAEENDVVMEEDEQFENMCGEADELPASSRPVTDLCVTGSPIWIDSVASGGLYRWKCVDEAKDESNECSAVLSN